jgi:phage terminase large subunit GpA-like protein
MTILLTSTQTENIKRAVRNGLHVLVRPEPMGLAEWADENFYLSSESSYTEGRWQSLPFQIAILNAIGHDDIRTVNFIKSARVGYSQMIRAAVGYFTEHKSRNQLLFQPTNGAAAGFMKAHIETMIRDVPVVKALAPWIGKKHRDNTLDTKRFSNGKQLWVLGGESSKNYREKSTDVNYYDELSAFCADVEKEGSPTFLGDKRLEGSVFPKSVRGSTPKLLGTCQISKAASESDYIFKFSVPCPHCDHEQVLDWGGKGCDHGFKWLNDDEKTVRYACISCGVLVEQREFIPMFKQGIWRDGETWTTDGLTYYQGRKKIETPEAVSFHIWTAYSPFTTWVRIVQAFIKAKSDPSALKSFINTTLGECWDDTEGEKIEPNALYMRREFYRHPVPVDNCIMTAAVDVQDDRLEIEKAVWLADEEQYSITYERLYGDLSRPEIWEVLARNLREQFTTPSGAVIETRIALIDSGGHFTDEVYNFSKRYGVTRFIPIKGHSVMGKPIIDFPRKRNKKGVYLSMIGTDTAKEIITSRLLIANTGAGYIHFPNTEQFDETYFQHLTNERKVSKIVKGRRVIVWDAGGRRNEPFDLKVYNLAAIRLLQQNFGINLSNFTAEEKPVSQKKKTPKKPKSMMSLES